MTKSPFLTTSRFLGFALLLLGTVLFVLGINASRSFGDQLSNTLLGHLTQPTTWYIITGIAATIIGFAILIPNEG